MAGNGRRICLIASLVCLALLFYSGYWWRLSHGTTAVVEQIVEQWNESGVEVEYLEVDVSGYPYRLQVGLNGVELQRSEGFYQPWLNIPAVKFTAHPWNLRHWVGIFEIPFQFGIELPNSEVSAEVGRGRTSIALGEKQRAERVSLQLNEVTFQLMSGKATGQLDQLQVHFREASSPKITHDIVLLLESLIIGNLANMEQSIELDQMIMEATLLGSIPVKWDVSSLNSWRTEGGVLEIHRLHASWLGVDMELSGTIAVDDLFRPIGAGTAIIEGYGQVLASMNRGGLIGRAAMIGATLALDLLSTTSQKTGEKSVQAPFTVQDGILRVGPVALMHVGAIIGP
jgi:hypothetical protein